MNENPPATNAPSGRPVTSYPDAWSRYLPATAGSITFDVAGYPTTIEITLDQLERVYLPLLAMLADFAGARGEPGRPRPGDTAGRGPRVLAGLAGIPGSGKSTFAAALAHVAHRVLPPDAFVVVGMDGWHLPNAVLDQRTTRDEAGSVIPLRQRKGGPESFDTGALADALRKLQPADRDVSLPVYDRQRHDPVPDALTVSPATRIILLEGNYLLSRTPPWNDVSRLLHPKLLLECDPVTARERIIARHIRGGLTPEWAADKYEVNDRLNVQAVRASALGPGVRIRLHPQPAVHH